MSARAIRMFEVKLMPMPPDDLSDSSLLGRMSIAKQFHGDLEGASKGQMLASRIAVNGLARYVAIELVTGTLRDRSGMFVLQHGGTMGSIIEGGEHS